MDNMNYMYSLNANNGELKLYVNFDVKTDPNIDQVLAQIRKSQADSKLPSEVRDYGVTVKKSTSSPLMVVAPLFARRAPTTRPSWPTMPTST